MSVLDIGCGWEWPFLIYGQRIRGEGHRGHDFHGTAGYAREHDAGHLVNWLLQDYRSMEGQFDRIVSVGMFEHVGRKNYDIFMKTTKRLLKPSGLFLLHTIGNEQERREPIRGSINISSPTGCFPLPFAVAKAITGLLCHGRLAHFQRRSDKTLMAWHQRFEEGYAEGAFQCSERVRRMYRYYLLSCAGAFRARDISSGRSCWAEGVEGGYCCQR